MPGTSDDVPVGIQNHPIYAALYAAPVLANVHVKLVPYVTGIVQPRPSDNGRGGYELTQKGRDLGQVILVLKRWGDTYREEGVPTVDFLHEPCGQVFVAELRCQACGRVLGPGELSLNPSEATC